MRGTILPPDTNPITLREIRAYQRLTPLWARRRDTIGIVVVALVLSLYLILRWITERTGTSVLYSYYYQLLNLDVLAYTQIVVALVYGALLVRCTTAGVRVASHYQGQVRDDLTLSGIDRHQLVMGQWQAAVFQVRGWMVALGLVRLAAFIVVYHEFIFNEIVNTLSRQSDKVKVAMYFYHPLQVTFVCLAIILLGLVEVYATTGAGLLTGTWLRRITPAWSAANLLRAAPALLFFWFPTFFSYRSAFDLPAVRALEYTWFAFADGGTTVLLRLAYPVYYTYPTGPLLQVTRGFIAFLAAFHMLLLYAGVSYLLTRLKWEGIALKFRTSATFGQRYAGKTGYRHVGIIALAGGLLIWMLWSWVYGPRQLPVDQTPFFYIPTFTPWLESILLIVTITVVLRALFAGIAFSRQSGVSIHNTSTQAILRSVFSVWRRLRGWWFGLALLYISTSGLTIAEHTVNYYAVQIHTCLTSERMSLSMCIYPYFGWHPTQILLIPVIAISLSTLTLVSSILIGRAAGTVIRSLPVALFVAGMVRAVPLIIGFLPPDVSLTEWGSWSSWYLLVRWHQDILYILGDSGISIVTGLAEPFWHTGHEAGRTQIGYTLLAFACVAYILIGYSIVSIIVIRRVWRRPTGLTGTRLIPVDPGVTAD